MSRTVFFRYTSFVIEINQMLFKNNEIKVLGRCPSPFVFYKNKAADHLQFCSVNK